MEEKFFENLRSVLDVEHKVISLEDDFRQYDEWNSLANLALIAMLDEEYGVVIPGDVFKQLSTVRDLIAEVQKRSS